MKTFTKKPNSGSEKVMGRSIPGDSCSGWLPTENLMEPDIDQIYEAFLDRDGYMALKHLANKEYRLALESGDRSSCSKGIGAASLAARSLASNLEDRELRITMSERSVELAFRCQEWRPRASAAFYCWYLGMDHQADGRPKRAAWFFSMAVLLGYETAHTPEGLDALEFGGDEIGINTVDANGKVINKRKIQKHVKEWEAILDTGSYVDLLGRLTD